MKEQLENQYFLSCVFCGSKEIFFLRTVHNGNGKICSDTVIQCCICDTVFKICDLHGWYEILNRRNSNV